MKSFLFSLAFVELYSMVLLWFMFRKQISHKGDTMLKVLLILFGTYVTFQLFLLLNPVYYYRRLQFSTTRLNLQPFRVVKEWKANPLNFFANILMFIPLGFFIILFHPEQSTRRKLLGCIIGGFSLSVLIEIAQVWTGRVSDIDDVLLNTFGSFLGGCLCLLEHRLGFDRTRIGRILLPRIPASWRGHMHIQRYCVVLMISAFSGIMLLNYLVTQPVYHTYTYQGQTLQLEAKNIALRSIETDDTVFEVNGDEQIYPASTLKILAALTAMDYVDASDEIQIGTEIYLAPMDCSRAGLEKGMTLTVRQLLEGILLPSGADAIYALGTSCGRRMAGDETLPAKEAMARFAEAMNQKAASLGAVHTNVVNPDGYDAAGQYSTANDILLITKDFLRHPVLKEICSLPNDLILLDNNKSLSLTNTNAMLHEENLYYNSSVTGVKTGTTNKAGNCLVSVFTIKEHQYICVVMGSSYDGKFRDTQALYEYCTKQLSGEIS